MKRTPLKRYKGLNKVSKKQQGKLDLWGTIKLERLEHLIRKYDVAICEYSGEPGIIGGDNLDSLDAHHIDGNRNNNTPENCYIVKRKYHSFITDNNIKVEQEDFQGCRTLKENSKALWNATRGDKPV